MKSTNILKRDDPRHNRAKCRARPGDAHRGERQDGEEDPAADIDNDPLLDTDQVAAIIGCTPQWLEKLRSAGRGCEFMKIGRLVRYRGSRIKRWLDGCSRVTEPK